MCWDFGFSKFEEKLIFGFNDFLSCKDIRKAVSMIATTISMLPTLLTNIILYFESILRAHPHGGLVCDQIWQNFITLVKVWKSLAIFQGFTNYLTIFLPFVNFQNYTIANGQILNAYSSHLVTLASHYRNYQKWPLFWIPKIEN